MIAKGIKGRIINISSVHEDWPMPDNTVYCLSKGGMRMMTRTAGLELAKNGITTMPKTWDEFKAVCRQLPQGCASLAVRQELASDHRVRSSAYAGRRVIVTDVDLEAARSIADSIVKAGGEARGHALRFGSSS